MKNSVEIYSKLPLNFYRRELLEVAPDLLGKAFVHTTNNKILAGVIVEVEAYDGRIDKAAHSYGGVTQRNKVMFEKGGLLYVYFIYGMHYCCNVVTGDEGIGNAVLIRAVQPILGIENMIQNRFPDGNINDKKMVNLTNGPAKLTQALEIDRNYNGIKLSDDIVYLCDSSHPKNFEIGVSKRIGIKKSAELPWRFYIKNNSYVSKK